MSATRPPVGEDSTEGAEQMAGRTRHPARTAAIVVAVVLAAFIVILATRPTADQLPLAANAVGRAVPAVQGTTLDGSTFDVDRLRGDWVVVNFFATWCVPCRIEHPELVRFSQEHKAAGDGVSVVSIAYDPTDAGVRSFFAEKGGDWPVVAGDGIGRIALDFGVSGVPESYLVSPAGQVVAKFTGVTAAGLDAAIAEANGGQAPKAGS